MKQIYSEKKFDPSCRSRIVELSAAEFSFFFFFFLYLNIYERGVWKSDEVLFQVVYIATHTINNSWVNSKQKFTKF